MVKKYTTEEARNFMKKITILLGLNSENIPDEIDLFYQMLITSVLNVYGEELIFERIEKAAKGIIDIDMKFYNKPIGIIWFIELCKNNHPSFQQ
ncbi:MAG: hypothetical protein WC998_07855 [Candidatus Paceibacterota bacterium]|jgi:hypothetical protein